MNESFGEAHRNHEETANNLKTAIQVASKRLNGFRPMALLDARHDRLMSYGHFKVVD